VRLQILEFLRRRLRLSEIRAALARRLPRARLGSMAQSSLMLSPDAGRDAEVSDRLLATVENLPGTALRSMLVGKVLPLVKSRTPCRSSPSSSPTSATRASASSCS